MKDVNFVALDIVYDLMRMDPGVEMSRETFIVVSRDPSLGAAIRKMCDIVERHIAADRKARAS